MTSSYRCINLPRHWRWFILGRNSIQNWNQIIQTRYLAWPIPSRVRCTKLWLPGSRISCHEYCYVDQVERSRWTYSIGACTSPLESWSGKNCSKCSFNRYPECILCKSCSLGHIISFSTFKIAGWILFYKLDRSYATSHNCKNCYLKGVAAVSLLSLASKAAAMPYCKWNNLLSDFCDHK